MDDQTLSLSSGGRLTLPQSIRVAAAVGGEVTIRLDPAEARFWAGCMERGLPGRVAVVEVDRVPSRMDWICWGALLFSALCGVAGDAGLWLARVLQ